MPLIILSLLTILLGSIDYLNQAKQSVVRSKVYINKK